MELRIFIFVVFVSVSVVMNTVVIYLAYKGFASMTTKLTTTMSEVRNNSEARAWIDSLQVAAEQAAKVTEATKLKFAEFDPALDRAQENYRHTLVTVDSKLENAAEKINTTAQKVRDIVAKPAFSVAAFAAGVAKVVDDIRAEE